MQFCFSKSSLSVLAAVSTFSMTSAQADQVEHIDIIGQRLSDSISLNSAEQVSVSPDLSDILVRLPGVDSNGNGPLTSIVQYRGLFGDRIRVNVDGAPVVGAGPNSMDPPLSNIFATSGTMITLHRGIAPVANGAETIGGAISVKKDHSVLFSDTPNWQAAVQNQVQSEGGSHHILGTGGYHSEEFYMSGFAAHQERDDTADGNEQSIPNSFYDRSAFGISSGFRFGQYQLTGNFQRINTNDTGTAALGSDIIFVDSDSYRLHYQWQNTQTGMFSLQFSGNNNQHDMNNFQYRAATPAMRSRLNSVDSLARGYQAVWQQGLAEGDLTIGAEWHTASYNSVIVNPVLNNLTINNFNSIERTTKSVFGQWQRGINNLDVTAGLRYTQVDASAGEVASSMAMMNPNVASLVNDFNGENRDLDFDFADITLHVNHAASPRWTWHVAVGQKGRAPSYTELYVWLPLGISAGLADGRNYLGNLNLEHETARQLDLGFTYEQNGTSVSPRIFYQDFDDYIVGSPSENMTANMISTMMSGRPPLQWDNVDATLYGFDILLSHKISDKVNLQVNGSVVKGERDDFDESLYRIAPASLHTRLMWSRQNWLAALDWQLYAKQDDVSDIQNEQESAGYGVLNANIRYQVNEHIEVTALVNNLFDKAYQPHLGGVNRIAGIEQPVGDRLFAPGRNLGISLSLRY